MISLTEFQHPSYFDNKFLQACQYIIVKFICITKEIQKCWMTECFSYINIASTNAILSRWRLYVFNNAFKLIDDFW